MGDNRIQIRHAAGSYWLLDMEQDGFHYNNPPALNESGIYIYQLLCEGKTIRQIAGQMKDEFGISEEQAMEDAAAFAAQMKEKGIIREE